MEIQCIGICSYGVWEGNRVDVRENATNAQMKEQMQKGLENNSGTRYNALKRKVSAAHTICQTYHTDRHTGVSRICMKESSIMKLHQPIFLEVAGTGHSENI